MSPKPLYELVGPATVRQRASRVLVVRVQVRNTLHDNLMEFQLSGAWTAGSARALWVAKLWTRQRSAKAPSGWRHYWGNRTLTPHLHDLFRRALEDET